MTHHSWAERRAVRRVAAHVSEREDCSPERRGVPLRRVPPRERARSDGRRLCVVSSMGALLLPRFALRRGFISRSDTTVLFWNWTLTPSGTGLSSVSIWRHFHGQPPEKGWQSELCAAVGAAAQRLPEAAAAAASAGWVRLKLYGAFTSVRSEGSCFPLRRTEKASAGTWAAPWNTWVPTRGSQVTSQSDGDPAGLPASRPSVSCPSQLGAHQEGGNVTWGKTDRHEVWRDWQTGSLPKQGEQGRGPPSALRAPLGRRCLFPSNRASLTTAGGTASPSRIQDKTGRKTVRPCRLSPGKEVGQLLRGFG